MKEKSRKRRSSTLELKVLSAEDNVHSNARSSGRTRNLSTTTQQQKSNTLRQTSSGRLREMARRQQSGLESLSRQANYGFQMESRVNALAALVELDRQSSQTMQALEVALSDDRPEIRAKAAALVGTYRQRMPSGIMKRMIGLVWDKELIVRRASVKALEFHPDPRSIGPLMGLLGTRDDELRRLVHHTLRAIHAQLGPAPRFGGDA